MDLLFYCYYSVGKDLLREGMRVPSDRITDKLRKGCPVAERDYAKDNCSR